MTFLILLLVAAAGFYSMGGPAHLLDRWDLWRRYPAPIRRLLLTLEARGHSGAATREELETLLALYREHADHRRAASLWLRLPEGHFLRRAALEAALLGAAWDSTGGLQAGKVAQAFTVDFDQDQLRVRLDDVMLAGCVQLVTLDAVMDHMVSGSQAGIENPSQPERGYRVLNMEAVVRQDLLASVVEMFGQRLGGSLSGLTVRIMAGEVILSGNAWRVPFQIPLSLSPERGHSLRIRLPRPAQVLGMVPVPLQAILTRMVSALHERRPGLIMTVGEDGFRLDLRALFPFPVMPNLSEIWVRPGEIVVRSRPGTDRRPVDIGGPDDEDPRFHLAPSPLDAAIEAGDLALALEHGRAAVAENPDDLVLRERVTRIALDLGKTTRASELLGPIKAHEGPRWRLLRARAKALMGATLDVPALADLEGELIGEPGDATLIEDLSQLAHLRWTTLRDAAGAGAAAGRLARSARAVSSPAVVVGALARGAHVAWEIADDPACIELASAAVRGRPLDASMLKLLGRAYLRAGRPAQAVPCLEAAVWLEPSDRALAKEVQQLADSRARDRSGRRPALPAALIHPRERSSPAAVLRHMGSDLDAILGAHDGPGPLPDGAVIVTRASHPGLVTLLDEVAQRLGLPAVQLTMQPGLPRLVPAGCVSPRVRIGDSLLSLADRDELGALLARTVWAADRRDVRFLNLDPQRRRAAARLVRRLGRALVSLPGTEVGTASVRDVMAGWLVEHLADGGLESQGLVALLPEDSRRRLASHSETRTFDVVELDRWCLSLEMTADRVALSVAGRVTVVIAALLKTTLGSQSLVGEARERGLGWALSYVADPGLLARIEDLIAFAATDWDAP